MIYNTDIIIKIIIITMMSMMMSVLEHIGGSERSKVGIGGDSGGGTISSSVAHDVPGLAFEVR